MNEENFKFTLSAPVDNDGGTIKLTVKIDDSRTLYLEHYPDFSWYLGGAVLVTLGGFLMSLLIDPISWVYCAIPLVVILYNVFYERALSCIINKNTGVINYHRSGVFMTSFDEQRSQHNISEIRRLEIHRHVRGGRWSWGWDDTFQIVLLLDNGQRVSLSSKNLDFSECQEFSEQIRNFIGNDIQIKAFG
jgi:hypothetical protein